MTLEMLVFLGDCFSP